LTEIERACLQQYQDSYVDTFARLATRHIPAAERTKLIMERAEEAARWDIKSLPLKYAHPPENVKVTPALTQRLRSKYGAIMDDFKDFGEEKLNGVIRKLAATELDSGAMSLEDYTALTGEQAKSYAIGYVNWWLTGTSEGRIAMLCACLPELTRDEILVEVVNNPGKIVDACRQIEDLTRPAVGNT
jgi:hypothetical protein